MQGSGTFAVRAIVQSSHPLRAMTDVTRHAHACSQVESVVTSVVPDSGRLLILSNGAYGKRLALIAERHGIDHGVVSASEREVITPSAVEAELLRAAGAAGERPYSHVVVVHHETTSGVLNPMHEIGLAVGRAAPDAAYIVDSMSAFGAYEVDMVKSNVSYMVSSANKNIEGVRRLPLAACCLTRRVPFATHHTPRNTPHVPRTAQFTTPLQRVLPSLSPSTFARRRCQASRLPSADGTNSSQRAAPRAPSPWTCSRNGRAWRATGSSASRPQPMR